ncbi:MAG: hypothetical protein ACRDJV_08405 [Actinomycetota bacterium]
MKEVLLVINHVYFLFGATVYVGTMWALRFFFFPSWQSMTIHNVQEHFIVPTRAATRFFTIVVPLMFVSGLIMLITEWGNDEIWPAAVAYLGIIASTFVGYRQIIPINKKIRAGVDSQEELIPLLKRWMYLNTLRFYTTTVMWAATVWYLVAKGNLLDALD